MNTLQTLIYEWREASPDQKALILAVAAGVIVAMLIAGGM